MFTNIQYNLIAKMWAIVYCIHFRHEYIEPPLTPLLVSHHNSVFHTE